LVLRRSKIITLINNISLTMVKIKSTFFFFFAALIFVKCNHLPFHIEEAYYQSWYKSENEKGTTIYFRLSDVKLGIRFDSLVFRGNELPLVAEIQGNEVKLTGQLNIGNTRIANKKELNNSQDQLLVKYQGKRFVYPVKLDRKEMKYYR